MEDTPFYYQPNDTLTEVKTFNSNGKFLDEKKLVPGEHQDETVGLICHYIAKGAGLTKVATGKGWRLSPQEFLNLISSDSHYEEMFNKAKKVRLLLLEESALELTEEKDIKAKLLMVKTLKDNEGSDSSKDQKFIIMTWADVAKYQQELKDAED